MNTQKFKTQFYVKIFFLFTGFLFVALTTYSQNRLYFHHLLTQKKLNNNHFHIEDKDGNVLTICESTKDGNKYKARPLKGVISYSSGSIIFDVWPIRRYFNNVDTNNKKDKLGYTNFVPKPGDQSCIDVNTPDGKIIIKDDRKILGQASRVFYVP